MPNKVTFFCCLVSTGKTLTTIKFRKCGILCLDRCYLCKIDSKLVDHLFYIVFIRKNFHSLNEIDKAHV